MKLNFAVLAESVYRDDEYRFHIRGVFHETLLLELPSKIESAALALEWEASSEEGDSDHQYTVHVTDPSGNRTPLTTQQIVVPAEPAITGHPNIMNSIVTLDGLPIDMPGQHRIHISLDGEEQSSISLYIHDLRD